MVTTATSAKRSRKSYADSMVGMQVRLVPNPLGAAASPWVQIVMVVPSRGRSCWMVSHFDGAVDIWPVRPGNAVYEFRSPPSHPQGAGD